MNKILVIFLTGYAQVFLVSANIYFISRTNWVGISVCGFGISFLWTFNVRKINNGSILEQFTYSFGAMAGGLCGVMMAKYIKR